MPDADKKIKVGIIGVTGHTGEELLRLLLRHPSVEITYLASRQNHGPVKDIYPWAPKGLAVSEIDISKIKASCDCVFLALPHTVSQEFAVQLYPDVVVIDLSADFRLKDAAVYEKWYKTEHLCPDLLKDSVYGLPEMFKEKIKTARLIANPGCYPTSIILGLYPLVRAKLIKNVFIDAKSGASGAGKKLSSRLLFVSLVGELMPYKVNQHQHIPEVLQILGLEKDKIIFVPHIVGIERGIISTMYVSLNQSKTQEDIEDLYQETYQTAGFISILKEKLPSFKGVVHTNQCHIAIRSAAPDTVIVISAIDNLIKGASGQAIQNMNLIFGLDEKEGLL